MAIEKEEFALNNQGKLDIKSSKHEYLVENDIRQTRTSEID